MSAEATSWAWSQGKNLSSQGAQIVLLALAEHASPTGLCYPNRKTIAAMCGYSSTNSVSRHINTMIDLGLIERNARFEAKGKLDPARQTSNEYRLKLEEKGEELGGAVAGRGGVSAEDPPSPLPGMDPSPPAGSQEPLKKEPDKEPTVPSAARLVYDHWLDLFKPQRPPAFGAAVEKQLFKGLAIYSAADLCLAFDGLAEWRKRKPGKTGLGAVLDTYPGGKPIHEQIAFFISQAKGATPGGGKFPSAPKSIIAEHQRWVLRGHRLSDNAEAVKRAKESRLFLFEHGIVVTEADSPSSLPSFRHRRDDDVAPAGGE